MSKRDWSKATRESLVALAACYLGPDDDRTQELIEQAADRLRAEVEAKLRTRAEVDAEAASVGIRLGKCYTVALHERLTQLGAEPTRDDSGPNEKSESSSCGCPDPGTLMDPGRLPFVHTLGPCGCDESVELRRIIKHIHDLAVEMVRVAE